jgi:hypothetical protein
VGKGKSNLDLDVSHELNDFYTQLVNSGSVINDISEKNILESINNFFNSEEAFGARSLKDGSLQSMLQDAYAYISDNQEVFLKFKDYTYLLKDTLMSLDSSNRSTSHFSDEVPDGTEDADDAVAFSNTFNVQNSTQSVDSWLINSDNVLIQLMLVLLQVFNECLDSLAIRGAELSTLEDGLSEINDASTTFAKLATAIAIAPDGVDSLSELFAVAGATNGAGDYINPELYTLVEPIAREMGMTLVTVKGSASKVALLSDTSDILDESEINQQAEDYFASINQSLVNAGGDEIIFPDPAYLTATNVDSIGDDLSNAALYAGNISQTMMQEMKVMQDFLSIYMQAAVSATTTNKEANQAVFR